ICSHYLSNFLVCFFFFSSRRRHTRSKRDWSSDVCSSDLLKYYFHQLSSQACHKLLHEEINPLFSPYQKLDSTYHIDYFHKQIRQVIAKSLLDLMLHENSLHSLHHLQRNK